MKITKRQLTKRRLKRIIKEESILLENEGPFVPWSTGEQRPSNNTRSSADKTPEALALTRAAALLDIVDAIQMLKAALARNPDINSDGTVVQTIERLEAAQKKLM